MKQSQAGFTIISALVVGGLLGLSSVAVIAMKSTIEKETRATSVKHAQNLADEIIKTMVAIKTREIATGPNARNELRTYLQNFISTGTSGFRIPVTGNACDAASPCYMRVLEFRTGSLVAGKIVPGSLLAVTTSTDTNPNSLNGYLLGGSTTTRYVVFVIGMTDAEKKRLGSPVSNFNVSVELPTLAVLNTADAEISGQLKCPLVTPIFKGTKPGPGNSLIADCQALAPGPNATATTTSTTSKITCNVAGGFWMSAIDGALTPNCVAFPQGTGATSPVNMCADGQVSKSYELDARFRIKTNSLHCQSKGTPYQFTEKRARW